MMWLQLDPHSFELEDYWITVPFFFLQKSKNRFNDIRCSWFWEISLDKWQFHLHSECELPSEALIGYFNNNIFGDCQQNRIEPFESWNRLPSLLGEWKKKEKQLPIQPIPTMCYNYYCLKDISKPSLCKKRSFEHQHQRIYNFQKCSHKIWSPHFVGFTFGSFINVS